MSLRPISKRLSRGVEKLQFGAPVAYSYNPLQYAWEPHAAYLDNFGSSSKEIILLGMNPGPFGMAQTGVPFGDVTMVRDWMGIEAPVSSPKKQHPKRPIEGFDCRRSEVSGTRLWRWAQSKFSSPDAFFQRFFVWNYCPLSFMEESGRNVTPDKLGRQEREALFATCDKALEEVVHELNPKYLIGIGVFAAKRCSALAKRRGLVTGAVLHPSPASPAANKDWEGNFERGLIELGVKKTWRNKKSGENKKPGKN